MEIPSTAGSQMDPTVGLAVTKLVLDSSKSDGASLVSMMTSAGSVNSSSQGRFIDARA